MVSTLEFHLDSIQTLFIDLTFSDSYIAHIIIIESVDSISRDERGKGKGTHLIVVKITTGSRRRYRATLGKTEKPKCTRCGKWKYPTGARCPACSATCRRCNRKGNYESQCYSKTKVSNDELTVDTAFLRSC